MPQRLIDHPKRFWTAVTLTILAVLVAIGIATWAVVTAKGAPDVAARRLATATAADQLRTCQIGNRTRPQIQVNQLVGIDGILQINPKITIDVRRQVAAAQVAALRPELAPGRSIGFRDCTGDGKVTRADFLPDETPPDGWDTGVPELLGPDGLPHVADETP